MPPCMLLLLPCDSQVKGFYIGMTKTEADEKLLQHLVTLGKRPEIYELKDKSKKDTLLVLVLTKIFGFSQ